MGKGRVIRDLVRGLEDARREIRVGHLQRSMAVVTGFAALASERAARRLLPALGVVTLVDGVLGFLYHIRGIRRMPGGFSLGRYNIVMGPPVFAPLLMCIVGTTGLLTGVVRREGAGRGRQGYRRRGLRARIARGKFQRVMAASAAGFAILAGGEAYFEHLRGSFNQWVMWTPVIVTPPMVAAGIGAMMSEGIARRVLPVASAVVFADGLLGFVLHLRGLERMPGGFRNLEFNLTMGPPAFAPLLLCAVGLMGLVASLLGREGR